MYVVQNSLMWTWFTLSVIKLLSGQVHDSDIIKIPGEANNSRFSENGSCIQPDYPKNGIYFIYGSDENPSPGKPINDREILIVECNDGYRLYGVVHILCSNGTWSYPLGQCLIPSGNRSCILPEHPKNGQWIVYRASITYYPGNETSDGDALYVKCDEGYVLDGINIISCMDGTWSYPVGKCSKFELLVSNRTGGCILPEHPKNGAWSVYGSSKIYSPGNQIGTEKILSVNCNKGYLLHGNNLIVCLNGTWSSLIGKCLSTKRCPPVSSTPVLSVTCFHNNILLLDCIHPVDGTVAAFQCAPFYEDQTFRSRSVLTCRNGSWSKPTPKCVPVCGVKSPTRLKRVINGTNVQSGDYPWQVAIYKKAEKLLICGGTLISLKVVLTANHQSIKNPLAAHCVTDFNGELLPKRTYIVAAGKYYREYDDNRDQNDAQFSKLQEIFVPKEYKGSTQNYASDIAVLVTVKTFSLSPKIQPVCVDWGSKYDTQLGEYGYVAGWGFTSENDNPSEVLKEVRVPLISKEKCVKDFPEDYNIYLTYDKFCAGYLDSGTALCKGDTGGGLIVKHNNGRHFITGIASLGPQSPSNSGGCDKDQYTLYTSVQQHIQFITKIHDTS